MRQIDYIQDTFKLCTIESNLYDIDTYEYQTALFTIIYFPDVNELKLDMGKNGVKDLTFDQAYRIIEIVEELKWNVKILRMIMIF